MRRRRRLTAQPIRLLWLARLLQISLACLYLSKRTALKIVSTCFLIQFLDRRRIGAVFRIVLSGGASVEIVVAPSLLPA